MSLLSLVLMVRDEALTIQKTLASAKPFVDTWLVLDTGSVDGTQALVRREMAGVFGTLVEEPFVSVKGLDRRTIDYAETRNRALDLVEVHSTRFSIFLSGDETLEGGDVLRSFLDAKRDAEDGAYCVELWSSTQRWFYPRVLRTGAGWRYARAIHERPRGPQGESGGPVIPGVRIRHEVSDATRRAKRIREVDLPVLDAIVRDETLPVSERADAMFHLAQAHEAVGDENRRTLGGPWISHKMQAMAFYRRFSEVERKDRLKCAYAEFRYLNLAESTGIYRGAELLSRLAPLAHKAPEIPEIRYALAVACASRDARRGLEEALHAAETARTMREKPSVHVPLDSRVEWLALRIAAACAHALGDRDQSRDLAQRGVRVGPREAFTEFLV